MLDLGWRARVDTVEGQTLGAGLLVTHSQVLTCAHVVCDLTRVHVIFPGVADPLPGTVAWRGPWRQEGDVGDLALVRLDVRPPVPACTFAGLDALRAQPNRPSCQLLAQGFPGGHDRNGAHVTIQTSDHRLLGQEWLQADLVKSHLQRFAEGFSGAAAYLPDTGDVVGMVTDAVLHDDGRGFMGQLLPIGTIRRYWEQLDDLLPLSWLGPEQRHRLRILVGELDVSAQPKAIFKSAFPGFLRPVPDFTSMWDAIRYVGESMVGDDKLRTLLLALLSQLDDNARPRLMEFIRDSLPVSAPVRELPPTLDASMLIRVDTPTRNGRTHLEMTVDVVIEGRRVAQSEVQRVRRDQLRPKVEKAVADYQPRLNGCEWMLEFAVPQAEMNHPFEEWQWKAPEAARPWPMRSVPVIVRHVDRLKPGFTADQARRRWQTLRLRAMTAPERACGHPEFDFDEFRRWLDASENRCALAYSATPRPDWLEAALDMGIPIMLWRRLDREAAGDAPGSAAGFLRQITEALSPTDPDQLPTKVMRLRKEAWDPEDGGEDHCGRHLTLFWDDPARRPEPPLAVGRD